MNADLIYQRVFGVILEQKLPPNRKINEEELASVFGVSRTIIRKVLLRLSHDGAVTLHRNRGAYVAAPSVDQVHDLYVARRTIECEIVAIACQVASREDVRKLKDVIQSEQECRANDDRSGRIRLSGEFHLEIARVAGNEHLYRFLRQLVIQTSLARANFEQKGVSPCSGQDHELLVDAIASGAVGQAKELMVRHLQLSESELDLKAPAPDDDLRLIFG